MVTAVAVALPDALPDVTSMSEPTVIITASMHITIEKMSPAILSCRIDSIKIPGLNILFFMLIPPVYL
jgi:hypothetical protein